MGNVERRGLRTWLPLKLTDTPPIASRQTASQSAGSFFSYGGKVSIHYRTLGQGPLTILFLHGFASASTTWQDLAGLFPGEDYTLFLLDLKGFGLSAKPKDGAYSIEDQAEVVKAFILDRGFCSLVLAGHSLGGAVALRVCIDAGRDGGSYRVAKLILIDSAAYP